MGTCREDIPASLVCWGLHINMKDNAGCWGCNIHEVATSTVEAAAGLGALMLIPRGPVGHVG